MASLLASYGSSDALAVARDLDKKVETPFVGSGGLSQHRCATETEPEN
jgi:hypothetical protein